MGEVTFTRDDMNRLTAMLGEFVVVAGLTKEEWNLLLAIFAVAADHVEVSEDETRGIFPEVDVKGRAPKIDDPVGKSARELRDQLRRAYIPGKATRAPIVYGITPPPGPSFTPPPRRPKRQPKPRPKPRGEGDQPGAP